jgi:hypothetical protein
MQSNLERMNGPRDTQGTNTKVAGMFQELARSFPASGLASSRAPRCVAILLGSPEIGTGRAPQNERKETQNNER